MSVSDRFRSCRVGASRRMMVMTAVAATLAGSCGMLLGQARPPAAAPAAPRAAAAAPAVPGLDGLSEKTVMGELAGRGLNTLLTRLFDERKVPQGERDSIRSLQALRELGAAPDNIPDTRRVSLLKASIEGLKSLEASLNDPNEVSALAITLVQRGIEPDANILDYWGDDSIRQGRVGPAADLAVRMIKKASDGWKAQATELEKKLKRADDPLVKTFEDLELFSTKSRYAAAEWVYYQLLGIDVISKKEKPPYVTRKALAEPAIAFMAKEYDNNDSEIGASVKLWIAKMRMRTGEFAEAKKQFGLILKKKTLSAKGTEIDMKPEPTEGQLNTARFFLALTDVLAGTPDAASKSYDDLVAWQKTAKTPEFVAFRDGIPNKAQLLMLSYRIQAAKAELAPAAQKPKLNEVADNLLNQLSALDDSFKELVSEQLVNKLKDKKPEEIKWADQTAPLLKALMARGYGEWAKPDGTPYDEGMLTKALLGAQELSKREVGKNGLSAGDVESAKIHVALFLQKQGKLVEAADRFLDYATDPAYVGRANVPKAMERAEYLAITAFNKDQNTGAKVYDRMLKIGVNPPFNRDNLFYYYAHRQRTKGEYAEANKFYAKIPKGDKLEFDARYWEMIGTHALISSGKGTPVATQRLLELAADVRRLAQAALAAAGNNAAATLSARFRLANATLTEAGLSLQQPAPAGPERAIAVLNGFDASVAGLPQAETLKQNANTMRVKALIGAGRLDEAIQQIQGVNENDRINMVRDILKQLEKDDKDAKAKKEVARRAKILNDRAKLTGFLIPFAKKLPKGQQEDMERALIFYDANAKFEAAEILPSGPEKDKRYEESLTIYDKQVQEGLKALVDKFTKLAETKKNDEAIAKQLKDYEDQLTAVQVNIARCNYELKKYGPAIEIYAGLLQQGKLGAPRMLVTDATGQVTGEEDNTGYWDSVYRLNMARFLQYQANPNDPAAQKGLSAAKQSVMPLFSVNANVGGAEYRERFLELRLKLDPKAPPLTPATAPAAAPATAPSAAR